MSAHGRRVLALVLAAVAFLGGAGLARGADLPTDRRELERFVYNHPEDDKALYRLAMVLAKEGDNEAAIRHLSELTRRKPRNAGLYYKLGLIYHRAGNPSAARNCMRVVLKLEPADAKAAAALTKLQALLTKRSAPVAARALELYEKDDVKGAAGVVDEALAVDAECPGALLVKALVFDDFGQKDEAARLFTQVLGLEPANGRAAARLARYEVGRGKMDEARRHVELALASAADRWDVHMAHAAYLAAANQLDLALTAVKRAVALRPEAVAPRIEMFNLEVRLKDFVAAARTVAGLEKDAPEQKEVLFLKGRLAYDRGRLEEAVTHLTAFLAAVPAGSLANLARTSISTIREQQGRYEEALDYISQAIRLDPHDASLNTKRATIREKWRLSTTGVRKRSGAFEFVYLPDTPPAVLERVDGLFQAAWTRVCTAYAVSPEKVVVKILQNTASALPAFYDAQAQEIVISREHFEGGGEGKWAAVSRQVVVHEFSHFVLRAAAGMDAFQSHNLWMIEGLAEHHAGALEAEKRADVAALFRDGLLSYPQLGNYLAVSAVGEGRERYKAYVQSALMTAELHRVHGEDACRRMLALMKDLSGGGELEARFQERLGMTSAQLMEKARLRVDQAYAGGEPPKGP